MDPASIVLFVAIVTGEGKKNIELQLPQASAEECLQEAKRILLHEYPDFVGAQRIVVQCQAPAKKSEPS